ncbi:MAG: 30S ribosomal protein S4 [Rickettsiales bacterium]
MAKIIRNRSNKPKFKAARSLRTTIWHTGRDTYTRRNSRPGQHGANVISKSGYGLQLEAKQRVRIHYGMSEKQFKNTFLNASKKITENKMEAFIQMLESRLSTLVYRAGFAPSIYAARQLISHKHILVNDKKVNISSYMLKVGDVVSCVDKDASKNIIRKSISEISKKLKTPDYIDLDSNKLSFTYKFSPLSNQISYPFTLDLSSIKLFYR